MLLQGSLNGLIVSERNRDALLSEPRGMQVSLSVFVFVHHLWAGRWAAIRLQSLTWLRIPRNRPALTLPWHSMQLLLITVQELILGIN